MLNLNNEYMKEENSKRTNLKIQTYFDIFLNEVLEPRSVAYSFE